MGSVCEHCGQETERYSLCTWCGLRLCPRCKSPKHHDCDKDPRRQEIASNAEAEPMESGSIMRDYIPREERPGYEPSEPESPSDTEDEGPGFVRQFVASIAGGVKGEIVGLGTRVYNLSTALFYAVLMLMIFLGLLIGVGYVGTVMVGDLNASDNGGVDDGSSLLYANDSAVENSFHDRLNEFRAERGLSRLSYDERLAQQAHNHSEDMNARDYLNHTSPEGIDPGDRYSQCRAYGEAILETRWGQLMNDGEVINSEPQLARNIIQSWKNSDPHRDTMLDSHWHSIGLGIHIDSGGVVKVTAAYCGS